MLMRALAERSTDALLQKNADEEYRRLFRRVLEAFGGLQELQSSLFKLVGLPAVEKSPTKTNTIRDADYADAVYTFEALLEHCARNARLDLFLDKSTDSQQRGLDDAANILAQHRPPTDAAGDAARKVLSNALFQWHAARLSFKLDDILTQALQVAGDVDGEGGSSTLAAAILAKALCDRLQTKETLPAPQRTTSNEPKSTKFVLMRVDESGVVRPVPVLVPAGQIGWTPACLTGKLDFDQPDLGVLARFGDQTVHIARYRRDQELWQRHHSCPKIRFGFVVGVQLSAPAAAYFRVIGTGAKCPSCGASLPMTLSEQDTPMEVNAVGYAHEQSDEESEESEHGLTSADDGDGAAVA
uniref:Uncharacterized protein n=1 Tax=Neobodo designis TaxID=312471 RepID=A0A7S1KXZ1_NEODS|mmetsp:Transcript_11070/g.34280  ORF Transcript_11070/g.34280 Transcript_11070/m.34280 type:complete len:356 (+) Transcript_11070:1-1068(+)